MLIVAYYNENNEPMITVVDDNGVVEIRHDTFKIVDAFTGEVIDVKPYNVIKSVYESDLYKWRKNNE